MIWEPKDITAGYAAIVATVALIWQIYNHVFRDRAKLIVSYTLLFSPENGLDEVEVHLSNIGFKPITIKEYDFHDGKDGKYSFSTWPARLLPKTLNPSEMLTIDSKIDKHFPWDKIKEIHAWDSAGKCWKAKIKKSDVSEISNSFLKSKNVPVQMPARIRQL